MISITLTGLMVSVVVALCLVQRTVERQHAAYVYAAGCAFHFLIFEWIRLKGIVYPEPFYYIGASVFSLGIVMGIHKLPHYTRFHQHLQRIAIASIVINFMGGAIQWAWDSVLVYQILAFALYLVLIVELYTDGRHTRVAKDRGLFHNLFWNTV